MSILQGMNWHKIAWIALASAQALLQAALVGAKLAGRVHWPWLWTLTPLWTPVACILAAAILAFVFFGNAEANGENPFE